MFLVGGTIAEPLNHIRTTQTLVKVEKKYDFVDDKGH